MMQEHVPAFFKGWYNDIVDPNLDIRDGYIHAPQRPGIGTRLKAGVSERPTPQSALATNLAKA